MQLPPVTVVCPNLSSNSLGRALLLAELLASETSVEIAGLQLEESVWQPALSSPITVRAYRQRRGRRHYFDAVPWLREATRDRFLIVSKPVLQSLGLTLLSGGARKQRMLVDIDDWQTGFFQSGAGETLSPAAARRARLRSYARRMGLNGFVVTRALEAYAKSCPRIVSNRFLQARFGGDIVYHVRDTKVLDPELPAGPPPVTLDRRRTWVGFIGTPRLHKGIDVLLGAVVAATRRAPVGLAIIGCTEDEPFVARARSLLGDGFVRLPLFPWTELAAHVRLPDIIAIPSLDVPAAWGQIPAKLFDAMAMAKPIIASGLNDIPEILSGVGLAIKPGDEQALADAICSLADDPAQRLELGRRARQRLVERYSYDAGRRALVDAVQRATRGA